MSLVHKLKHHSYRSQQLQVRQDFSRDGLFKYIHWWNVVSLGTTRDNFWQKSKICLATVPLPCHQSV